MLVFLCWLIPCDKHRIKEGWNWCILVGLKFVKKLLTNLKFREFRSIKTLKQTETSRDTEVGKKMRRFQSLQWSLTIKGFVSRLFVSCNCFFLIDFSTWLDPPQWFFHLKGYLLVFQFVTKIFMCFYCSHYYCIRFGDWIACWIHCSHFFQECLAF
jgi:hypothetical protein